ncbi:hypothetical protein RchiOBHm_Chr5g0050841 [Rosa chinensis]|uniref:Uncharacterized protein n=1 Tax=Rosa chinensis TaxID=74649 RepID=A0A2P6QF79_ROSCH|nr:hypothetical protein RchiOBHm_Chr5g0050841 [Rosa chinensis]
MSFPSFLSSFFLSYYLTQISDFSWLRCTSSSRIGLPFTDCSLVHRSSVVSVTWIVYLNRVFPLQRVNPMITVAQQGSVWSSAVCPVDPSADQIWVMEIYRWVLCCCSCTGWIWLDSKFSPAGLVTFLSPLDLAGGGDVTTSSLS